MIGPRHMGPVSAAGQGARALERARERLECAGLEVEPLTLATFHVACRGRSFPRVGVDALGGLLRWDSSAGDPSVIFSSGAMEDLDALECVVRRALEDGFCTRQAVELHLQARGLTVSPAQHGLLAITCPEREGTWVFLDAGDELGFLNERDGTALKKVPGDARAIGELFDLIEMLFQLARGGGAPGGALHR